MSSLRVGVALVIGVIVGFNFGNFLSSSEIVPSDAATSGSISVLELKSNPCVCESCPPAVGALEPRFEISTTSEPPVTTAPTASETPQVVKSEREESNEMTLVLFVSHDSDSANENLEFFLNHGIVDKPNMHYVFILNGCILSPSFDDIVRSLGISSAKVEVFHRPNEGFDFCGWSTYLRSEGVNIALYKYFVLLNGTVRGPFLPPAFGGTWVDAFTEKLRNNVHMVGTSINCRPNHRDAPQSQHPALNYYRNLHVQSMLLVFDRAGLDIFLSHAGCSDDHEVAIGMEIALTRRILDAGFNIDTMMILWNGANFDDTDDVERRCGRRGLGLHGDVNFPGHYEGIQVSPLEVVFVKTNRYQDTVFEKYTEWAWMRKRDRTSVRCSSS